MKYPLFLHAPEAKYPLLLHVDSAAGTTGRRLAGYLPDHRPLSVAGKALNTLTLGTYPLSSGAYLEPEKAHEAEPTAVSTLYILRGPDAGRSFTIPRGHTPIGRTPKYSHGIALNDVYLAPEYGELILDSSGAYLHARAPELSHKTIAKGPLRNSVNRGPERIRWDTPFTLGSSTCILTAPGKKPTLATKHGSPFEPITVNLDTERKIGALIIMACLPIIIGLTIALMTGMWFFLIMSVASSALMAVHMFSGRSENRKSRQQIQQAIEAEYRRATSLTSAGHTALGCASRNGTDAIVLGLGTRLPFISGRNLKMTALKKQECIPHYVPAPSPELPHELRLETRQLHAYLVQLIAAYPGEIYVLLHDYSESLRATLACLGVIERVRLCACAEQIAEALAMDIPEPKKESFGRAAQPATPVPLFISLGLPPSGVEAFPRGASLCIIHPPTNEPEDSPLNTALLLRAEGEYRQRISYTRTGMTPQELIPADNVGQVHPLELQGTCAIADGLSAASYIRALGILAQYTAEKPVSAASDAMSVHSRPLRLSELGNVSDSEAPAAINPLGLLYEESTSRWEVNRYATDIYCLLGSAPGGYLNMGLSEHGPHWIIGGTTGAGKSQLLRSLILSAALRYGPERLGLILVDFKGSAGLGPLAQLPQTLSMLSNFDVSAVHRALEFLRADVRRRERDLLELGVNSYRDYLRLCESSGEVPRYPELVIVVDEFRMLVESMPDAMTELMKIATIGRSLGLHLILATQRPQGSISQDIRANIASNICLRVASGQDSYNLLGHEGAANIPASYPGAGYVRLPDGQNLPFRAPLVDALASNTRCSLVQVRVFTGAGWESKPEPNRMNTTGAETVQDYLGEDAQLMHAVDLLRHSYNTYSVRLKDYCPIPDELPEYIPHRVDSRPFSYTLGELEIARYGVRQLRSWGQASGADTEGSSASGALAILGSIGERAALLNALIAQGAARSERILVFTSDASLHRRLASLPQAEAFFEVLVGPHELAHLQYCLQQLRNGYLIPHAETGLPVARRALIIIDGLDSWLELLLRLPQVESQLYDLLAQGHRHGLRVVFTSALAPRSRFASVAHASLLSRRFVETDIMRKAAKNYPIPAQGHFAVEGSLNTELIGDEPLEAAALSPLKVGASELTDIFERSTPAGGIQPLTQFPATAPRIIPDEMAKIHELHPGALFCGYRRGGKPVLIQAPQGVFIPVPGARSSGKSTFLQNVGALNPQYGVVRIHGSNDPDATELRELFEGMDDCERTILAVDDVPYISAATQQVILEFGRRFRTVLTAYTPYTRWLSSPVLASLSGCSRAIIINPRSLSDGDICTLSEMPLDLYTDGSMPPGRAIVVDGGHLSACQLPYA